MSSSRDGVSPHYDLSLESLGHRGETGRAGSRNMVRERVGDLPMKVPHDKAGWVLDLIKGSEQDKCEIGS